MSNLKFNNLKKKFGFAISKNLEFQKFHKVPIILISIIPNIQNFESRNSAVIFPSASSIVLHVALMLRHFRMSERL